MLRLVYRLFLVCIALIVLVIGIAFIYNNQQPISVDFLIWQAPKLAFGLIILIGILFGFSVVYVVGVSRIARLRIRNKSLLQKVHSLQQRNNRLEQDMKEITSKKKAEKALQPIVNE